MLRFLAGCALVLSSSFAWSQNLVVSTQPIYLIAKAVTQGVETPTLLLADQSGHDVSLTPGHRKTIQEAGLLLWLGQAHEAPLDKVLKDNKKAISILDSGIVKTLPLRNARGESLPNTIDTHVWLDPNNVVRMGFFIAALRSQQHPEHKEAYWKNARAFAQQMLLQAQRMQPSGSAKPYWAYHDAYQYLESALNLDFAGALTEDAHMGVTIAQIKHLNDSRPNPKMCLLAEGHASASGYQKLNPIVFQSVDESMSGESNFIKAWSNLAQNTQKCILTARS